MTLGASGKVFTLSPAFPIKGEGVYQSATTRMIKEEGVQGVKSGKADAT